MQSVTIGPWVRIETQAMLRHNRLTEGDLLVIELENVAYSYSGGELLSDISLKLAPGSFHFLTGPSGSGKTTLMKLCYGALLPTAGHVRLFDTDVRALTRDDVALVRRRVGVVHQDCQFLDHLLSARTLHFLCMCLGAVQKLLVRILVI